MKVRPLVTAAAVLLLAACNSSQDRPTTMTMPGPTSSAPTTAALPTTTAAPPTATTLSSVPVGENLDAVVRALSARVTQLARKPDLAALDGIYDAEANVRPKVESFVRNLIACGCRYDDEGTVIVSTSIVSRAASNVALVEVITRHGPQRVVDADGKVVETGAGWEPRREHWQLIRPVREPDQPWRIRAEQVVGPA